ncbi:MAG: nucleotidyltransferase domain-containing protein [Patescibacteria group bacterium]
MDVHRSQLVSLFTRYKEIKLVYLFGSQVTKKTTPLSDYDFAIYLDEKTPSIRKNDIILDLNFRISSILKTNSVDVVILNNFLSPLLKFNIINDGKLIYEKIPYRLMIEPQIFDQYFDFKIFQNIYNI